MADTPLVSVILLSYNQSEYLDFSIISVINQTYIEWELIIIDNGSKDDSHLIIKKYLANKKIKSYLHSTNMCLGKRMNEGITAASGDLISVLYSDDYYLPEKLTIQVDQMQKLSSDWGAVYGPGYRLDMSTNKLEIKKSIECSGDILKKLFTNFNDGFINPISPLMRRECFLKYPFYEDVFIESEAIFFRIAMKYKFFYIDEPLVVMRDTGNNAGYAAKQNSEFFAFVLEKLGKHEDFPNELLFFYRKFKGTTFRNNAWQNIRAGTDSEWVRSMLKKSISSNWKEILHPKTIIAFVMSFLPIFSRKIINSLVNKIINKEKIIYIEDYYP
jgi:glycosyltransferase involved in cell wall biosynthesis